MFVLYNFGLCVNCGRDRSDAFDSSGLGIHDPAFFGTHSWRHPMAKKIKYFIKASKWFASGLFLFVLHNLDEFRIKQDG